MRPHLRAALILAALTATGCGPLDGGGQGSADQGDVGAELACDRVAENYGKILANPEAHPSELGEIIGFAESSDDPKLRDAAQRFNEGPTSGLTDAFKDIRRRCEELGLL
jgi:hypothetical protein